MPGRNDSDYGGYSLGNPFRRRRHKPDDSPGGSPEIPVDLAAVQADDALLDMLGSASVGDGDAELARVLVAWRRDVDTEEIGELVNTDTALSVIKAARRPAPRRHPVLGPVAAAAAVVVIAFSGVGLAAKSAEPGDRLFGLTKVLYADYARSVEAAKKVETELAEAETALQQGDTVRARQSLELVQEQLAVIGDKQDRTELATKRDKLEEQLQEEMSDPAEAGPPHNPVPEVPTSSQAPVPPVPPSQPVTSAPATSASVTPPSPPPPDPSTLPTPSRAPNQPEAGTSQLTPRGAPPVDGSGAPAPGAPSNTAGQQRSGLTSA